MQFREQSRWNDKARDTGTQGQRANLAKSEMAKENVTRNEQCCAFR